MINEGGVVKYDIVAMIGKSDQSCWLAEACQILLLLLTAGG